MKCHLLFAAIVSVSIAGRTASAGQIHSAVDDFSTTTNTETSTSSYRFRNVNNSRVGTYDLLTTFSNQGNWTPVTEQWNRNAGEQFGIPAVAVNKTGGDISWTGNNSGFEWPTDTIWMHPKSNGLVVVSWLSPFSGTVDIEFLFKDIDLGSVGGGVTGINWFVDKNDSSGGLVSALASGGFTNGGESGLQTTNGVSVNAGDRLNFIVDANGSFFFDSTAFTATITSAVPEPSSVALGLSGVAILLGAGWWKRKRQPVSGSLS